MRRIDALGIGTGVFIIGGLAYLVLQLAGLDNFSAGVWSQVLLICGLVGWVFTYVFRAVGNKMTYHEQRAKYEQDFLQKQLDQLSNEERNKLLAQLEPEEETQA